MISKSENEVPWVMLLYELDDASNHLSDLISQMVAEGAVDDDEYATQLGHVFAHLNRAWNGRNDVDCSDTSEQERVERSQFPVDLKPVG